MDIEMTSCVYCVSYENYIFTKQSIQKLTIITLVKSNEASKEIRKNAEKFDFYKNILAWKYLCIHKFDY